MSIFIGKPGIANMKVIANATLQQMTQNLDQNTSASTPKSKAGPSSGSAATFQNPPEMLKGKLAAGTDAGVAMKQSPADIQQKFDETAQSDAENRAQLSKMSAADQARTQKYMMTTVNPAVQDPNATTPNAVAPGNPIQALSQSAANGMAQANDNAPQSAINLLK
ncbi:MAG: hypothetical protein HQK81_07530 [Desulfovibrionaceae bacterium]|nr:hypothetical protein [Desulfovibrionaceae bacterium]MBF0513901.1 hypothetical protein [Desulfovibrionaceae bacterium]